MISRALFCAVGYRCFGNRPAVINRVASANIETEVQPDIHNNPSRRAVADLLKSLKDSIALLFHELLRFLLVEMRGDQWVNVVRQNCGGTIFAYSLMTKQWHVAQSILDLSTNLDPQLGWPIEQIIVKCSSDDFRNVSKFLQKNYPRIVLNPFFSSTTTEIPTMLLYYSTRLKIHTHSVSLIKTILGPTNRHPSFFFPIELLNIILSYHQQSPVTPNYNISNTIFV